MLRNSLKHALFEFFYILKFMKIYLILAKFHYKEKFVKDQFNSLPER
jgi:hypothetical protein